MTTHMHSEQPDASVIHRTARINAAVFRATEALESTRAAAWDDGSHGRLESEREARFAAVVSAAVAELAALAHGVDEVAP